MAIQEWYLKRNCSLSPRQAGIAYAVQCVAAFIVATLCTLQGVWQIFIFSALEMLAVGAAYLVYARHATDNEHIALIDGCLLIERTLAGRLESIRLDPDWTRIATPKRYQDLIRLESRGKRIEIGRFVSAAKRKQIARELQSRLHCAA
jgi:uncharacterized membrane protein